MKNILLILGFTCIITYIQAQEIEDYIFFDYVSSMEIKKNEKINESPYAMFGDNTTVLKTDHEKNLDHSLKIPLTENDKYIGLFELNFQTAVATITDTKGDKILQQKVSLYEMARFLTIDPMAEKYYSISPYVYVANNPLKYTDPNGDTIRVSIFDAATNGLINYNYGVQNNVYGFYDAAGNIYAGGDQFVATLTTALGTLRSQTVGRGLVDDLAGSTNIVTIRSARANENNFATPAGDGIVWDSSSAIAGWNTAGNQNRPAFIGLGHEMAHVQDIWKGTFDGNSWVTVGANVIPNAEKYATHIENQIRAEHGVPLRTHYAIDMSTGSARGLSSTRIINTINSSGTPTHYSRFYKENLIFRNPVTGRNSVIPGSNPFRY